MVVLGEGNDHVVVGNALLLGACASDEEDSEEEVQAVVVQAVPQIQLRETGSLWPPIST